MDAQEVVQECLLIIRKEYREITFNTSFSAWAYKVLDNQIMAYIKTQKRRAKNVQSMKEFNGYPSQQKDINPDLKIRLQGCLRKIYNNNMRYARVLNLHYQGFSTEEICRKLTITATNLYATLSRARSLLEYCLEKGDIK
jgi:RNA polymerase sigma factor (sigma-70 family)